MQPGDPVHRVAAHDGEVGHPDPPFVPLFDQGHAPDPLLIAGIAPPDFLQESAVDLEDDGEVARQDPRQQSHRPFLERLRQDGVVRVAEGGDSDLPGSIPVEMVAIHEQAHELRNGDGGVSVVELHGHHLGEAGEIVA